MDRYWMLLWFAGLSEIGWVAGLKHADSPLEWLMTAAAVVVSFGGLLAAANVLPVGTAYAVFTGIGAAGTVLAESLAFGAPFEAGKMALVVAMVIGIAGLKKTSAAKSELEPAPAAEGEDS